MLNEILYLAFLSLVVCYADYRMTANNMGAIWNGIGAIPSVLRGEAQLPMQHRLLIPLICKWFCGIQRSPQGYYNVYVRRNIRTIKKTLVNFVLLNEYMFFFSLMLFSIVIYVVGIQTLLPIDMVMAGFVLLMLIPSMWREIRVFSPFMLTFIPLVERVL